MYRDHVSAAQTIRGNSKNVRRPLTVKQKYQSLQKVTFFAEELGKPSRTIPTPRELLQRQIIWAMTCYDDVDKTMFVEQSSLENKASSAWLISSCVLLDSSWHHEHITSQPWSTTIIDSWDNKDRGHWVCYYHDVFWNSIKLTHWLEAARQTSRDNN
jgi:hypothetical protein